MSFLNFNMGNYMPSSPILVTAATGLMKVTIGAYSVQPGILANGIEVLKGIASITGPDNGAAGGDTPGNNATPMAPSGTPIVPPSTNPSDTIPLSALPTSGAIQGAYATQDPVPNPVPFKPDINLTGSEMVYYA